MIRRPFNLRERRSYARTLKYIRRGKKRRSGMLVAAAIGFAAGALGHAFATQFPNQPKASP